MYLIKTYLDRSAIHGIGVFAGEDIPKGTKVWDFVEGFDQVIDQSDYDALPPQAQEYLTIYAWWENGKIWICGDNGRYTNHSDEPNVVNWPNADSMAEAASRDIKKGEELTSDYRSFDDISKEDLDSVIAA